MSNKILNLDLSKDPIMPAIVYGRVGDDRLQTVTVNLTRRDEVADLTGYDITFEGTTYNRQTKVFDSNNISSTPEGLKKGTFDYTFPNMAFAVAGKYEQAYFSIAKDGKRDSTAGFEIYVDGNADIDAPEAETVITEYNKLVAELNELQNQAISELNEQQNQAIDEMNRNFTEAQGRISELEVQINDLRNKIDQALTDFENGNFWTKEESFNKEESSANVIYQVIGKDEVEMTLTFDLKNKIASSDVENPNSASFRAGPTLYNPNQFTADAYINYLSLYSLDGTLLKVSNSTQGNIAQVCIIVNILEELQRFLGQQFFIDRGAVTEEQKVAVLEMIVTEFTSNIYGFGVGTSGNLLTQKNWYGAWTEGETTTANTVTRIGRKLTNSDNNWSKYINGGKIPILITTGESDGVTSSSINLDYANVEVKLKLSANEHIKLMIAANQVESIATGEEAEEGKTDEKLMTPLKTKEFYLNETKARRQKWDEGLNWIAHRGNNTEYPENSLPAFQQAKRHWGIETDIQVTSDGKWVVMHDSTVDRTTNGTGSVSSFTLAQFRALRIDTGANLAGLSDAEKIPPTLEEYLLICKQLNKVPIIEIKSFAYTTANYTLLKDTLNLFGYDETNCVIGSFDYAVLGNIRAIYPNMELHYFVDSISTTIINQLTTLGIPAVCSCAYGHASVTSANVKLIHSAGLKVGVWTVPDASFDAMIKLGVDYITTNSLSGNLRYAKLSYQNGFIDNQGVAEATYIEELGGSAVHVNFNVENGVNTQNSPIALFPSWAIPIKRQYSQCSIRTSSSVVLGTFDINARTNPSGVTAGSIAVGLNWSSRSSWAAGSTVYKV